VSERMIQPDSQPALSVVADQVMELAAEVGLLRESITTAAEWDNQARQDRQQVLDSTLATVRRWLRILVRVTLVMIGVNLVLLFLLLWLVLRARG
jgi:hypothetical protein